MAGESVPVMALKTPMGRATRTHHAAIAMSATVTKSAVRAGGASAASDDEDKVSGTLTSLDHGRTKIPDHEPRIPDRGSVHTTSPAPHTSWHARAGAPAGTRRAVPSYSRTRPAPTAGSAGLRA